MAIASVVVAKGDVLFFRIQNKDYGYGGEVQWNPKITYTVLPTLSTIDENGKSTTTYDAQQDFIMNNDGGVLINYGDSSIAPNFNIASLSGAFTDDIRFIIKHVRQNNDSDAEPALMNTWIRTYNHTSSTLSGANPPSTSAPGSGYTDIYYFYAESNSNVNWSAINWQPKYTLNTINSFAPVNYNVFDENIHQKKYWIDASTDLPNVTTTVSDQNNPLLEMTNNLLSQDLISELTDYQDIQFPLKISWVVKVKNTSGPKVHHSRDFWLHKISGNYLVLDGPL